MEVEKTANFNTPQRVKRKVVYFLRQHTVQLLIMLTHSRTALSLMSHRKCANSGVIFITGNRGKTCYLLLGVFFCESQQRKEKMTTTEHSSGENGTPCEEVVSRLSFQHTSKGCMRLSKEKGGKFKLHYDMIFAFALSCRRKPTVPVRAGLGWVMFYCPG